jgi:TctA family transporter
MRLSQGDFTVFVNRPISGVILARSALLLVLSVASAVRSTVQARRARLLGPAQ